MAGNMPRNLVQTNERTALILDILGRYPNCLSLGNLAREAYLPKGTTHRLVRSMAYFDFIHQNPATKNCQLGFKLADLGNLLLSQIDLRSEAHPYLIHLSKLVKETIHLVVLDGHKALYIDKVDLYTKSSGLQMISRLGSRIGLHCSSVGKVLLAHMGNHEAKTIISKTGLTKRFEKREVIWISATLFIPNMPKPLIRKYFESIFLSKNSLKRTGSILHTAITTV